MASNNASGGKKRSKSFYRKSAYGGGKRQCTGRNILEPGIKGFLVMCHGNESGAVREAYNILNEYGDIVYGPDKTSKATNEDDHTNDDQSGTDDDCDDLEKALEKEVKGIKEVQSGEKRFQNVATKAKNCVFIRTTVEDPVKLVTTVMEDIAARCLKKARHAARMLPIVGTCKAQTAAISELAKTSLASYFSKENPRAPSSFTIIFKARNNNGSTCGRESLIPAIKSEVLAINPDLKFSWSDFDVAILIEIVCTICCLGVAPGFDRLRKYNFQELAQGPKLKDTKEGADAVPHPSLLSSNLILSESERDNSVKTEDIKTEISEVLVNKSESMNDSHSDVGLSDTAEHGLVVMPAGGNTPSQGASEANTQASANSENAVANREDSAVSETSTDDQELVAHNSVEQRGLDNIYNTGKTDSREEIIDQESADTQAHDV